MGYTIIPGTIRVDINRPNNGEYPIVCDTAYNGKLQSSNTPLGTLIISPTGNCQLASFRSANYFFSYVPLYVDGYVDAASLSLWYEFLTVIYRASCKRNLLIDILDPVNKQFLAYMKGNEKTIVAETFYPSAYGSTMRIFVINLSKFDFNPNAKPKEGIPAGPTGFKIAG